MNHEPEIDALNITFTALKDLNQRERKRIIKWAKDRFGLTGDKPPGRVSRTGKAKTEMAAAADQKSIISEEEPQKTVKKVRKKKIKDFETVLDLFSTAAPKTSTEKVVLMATYLQEKQDFRDELIPIDGGRLNEDNELRKANDVSAVLQISSEEVLQVHFADRPQ